MPRKSELEETEAEKVPLKNIRRNLAVHMDKERGKYFEYCKGKQKPDCPECDIKNTKHHKYWEVKTDDNLKSHHDTCACRNAHKKLRFTTPDGDKLNKHDFDRIVENAAIEYDLYKKKKKSILSLGVDNQMPKTPKNEEKRKIKEQKIRVKKKKSDRDENDIYGEHIAMQLRNLKNPRTVALARLKIDQVIFGASIGDKAWTNKHLKKLIKLRQKPKTENIIETEP